MTDEESTPDAEETVSASQIGLSRGCVIAIVVAFAVAFLIVSGVLLVVFVMSAG